MNTKFKLATLAAAMYFITGCNDSTTTTNTDKKDVAMEEHTDTSAHAHTADNNMSTAGTDLMAGMNSMMHKMHNMKMTGDFDQDFANMMIEHHQGAIDMSQIELKNGTDEKMKAKAQDIIIKQTAEIDQLRNFLAKYKTHGMKHGEGDLEKSMAAMKDKMPAPMHGNIDRDFANMMIIHHEGAISMSEMELANGMNKELKAMAKKGKADQTKEVTELKTWLAANN